MAPPPESPSPDIGSVTVSASAEEVAVDDQLQLSATVRDRSGVALSEPSVTWTSSAPEVASIDEAGLLSGLGLGSATVTATAEGVSGALEIDVRGFMIASSGGIARSSDGRVELDVPPDALAEPAVIMVEPADAWTLPVGTTAIGYVGGSAYRFEPAGQQFQQPVALRVTYDPASIPSGVDESSLALKRAAAGTWAAVAGSVVDTATNEVRASVSHFSVYGAVGDPPSLSNRVPGAHITAPADGSSFQAGVAITFAGEAVDFEDAALPDSSLVWTSELDGQLGTSDSVTTSALSVGVHTITFIVSDSDGASGGDDITVTILNNPPTATITAPADGSSFFWGTSVNFTGTGTDPEDGPLSGGSLVWTSDLDGQFGTGTSVSTSALSIGVHTITLTVTDSHGGTDTDQITVTIQNNPPTATITAPPDGSTHVGASGVTFTGTGTDPEDGTLSGGSLVWTSSVDGQFGTGGSVTTSTLSLGVHTITLTVTDSHGATDTDQITITII